MTRIRSFDFFISDKKYSKAALLFLFCIIALVVYSNALFSDFIGDDVGRIITKDIYFKEGLASVFKNILMDRPFLTLTIWLNYFFFGMAPLSYKLVNIMLHALCGFSVYVLLTQLFVDLKNKNLMAFFVALIFLVHPINNQAVNSVIQRGVELSTLFSLLSFVFVIKYANKGQIQFWLAALFCFLLALLSKPNSLVLPLMLLLYFYNQTQFSNQKILKTIAPFFILWLVPLLFYVYFKEGSQALAIPTFKYFLIQTQVIFFYFSKYMLPLDLQFIYPINNSYNELVAYNNYFYLIMHVLILMLALFFLHKKNRAALMLLFGYILFIPESSFFSIIHVVFDHRNYFPLIFFISFFVLVFFNIFEKFNKPKISASLFFVFALALGGVNYSYSSKINTYEKWMFYNLEKNPTNKSNYTYNMTFALENKRYEVVKKIIDIVKPNNPNDEEIILLQNLVDFEQKTLEEQKSLLIKSFDWLTTKNGSIHVFYFFEKFFKEKFPLFFEPSKVLLAMNSFYFSYADYAYTYVSAKEYFETVKNNYSEVVRYYERQNNFKVDLLSTVDGIIYLRSKIALSYYYKNEKLEINFYENLLMGKYKNLPESVILLKWLNELKASGFGL